MRSVLAFSIALNLLLVTSIVVARVDLSRGSSRATADLPSAPEAPEGAFRRTSAEAGSLAGYYRALRAQGLNHEETYLPLAGRALRALAVESGPEVPYWRAPPAVEATGERRAAVEGRLRRELEALYGEEAESRPELAVLFRPLGPGFESMSSAQQLAVVAARRARLAGEGQASFAGTGQGRGSTDRVCAGFASQPPSGWMDDLDAATRFELALRTSPLAAGLRTVDLDEAQFRGAFAVLERFASAASVDEQRTARSELEKLLGVSQSDRLLRELDPAYRRLAAYLSAAGVAPGPIDAAYAIVAEAREAMIDAIGSRGAGVTAAGGPDAGRLAAIARDETEQLAGLLGPELAGHIVGRRSWLQDSPDDIRAACAG